MLPALRRFVLAAVCALGLTVAGCSSGSEGQSVATSTSTSVKCNVASTPRLVLRSGPPTPVVRAVVGECVEVVIPKTAPVGPKPGSIVLRPSGGLQLEVAPTKRSGLRTSIYLAKSPGATALSATTPARSGVSAPEWGGVVVTVPNG
jgi:hypothetical protein